MTHHEQVLSGLQVPVLAPCLGQVLAHVQGSWPAGGHGRARTALLVPVLAPCLGRVLAHGQGSWPAADLQARRRGVTCWAPEFTTAQV